MDHVPNQVDRWIGVAGLFNTGTNLLNRLLRNCKMPGEKNSVLWQVPWGKHSFANTSRNRTTAPKNWKVVKDNGLAVVVTRDPYTWAQSMCRNPYILKWERTDRCPNVTAKVKSWGGHENLFTFYNSWYEKYWKEFPYPRIFVRVEDLTLRPQETIKKICDCAGGNITDTFQHMVKSAKDENMGHESTTGMVEAWKRVTSREVNGGLTFEDYTIARKSLADGGLMDLFAYKNPLPSVI